MLNVVSDSNNSFNSLPINSDTKRLKSLLHLSYINRFLASPAKYYDPTIIRHWNKTLLYERLIGVGSRHLSQLLL